VVLGKRGEKLDADDVVVGELLGVGAAGRMYDAVKNLEEKYIAVAAVVAVELDMTELEKGSYAVEEEEGRKQHALESFAAEVDTSIVIVEGKSMGEERNVPVALAGQNLEVLETVSGESS
jgi:hypothetical protein